MSTIEPQEPWASAMIAVGAVDPRSEGVASWNRLGEIADVHTSTAAVNVLLAAGLAESLNACGGNVRRTLACAAPVEAGTRRTDLSLAQAA